MKVLFIWTNKDCFGFKPVGLSLLSAIAKQLGWQTKLFDCSFIDFGFAENIRVQEMAKVYKPVDLSVYGKGKEKCNVEETLVDIVEAFGPDLIAFSVLSDEFTVASRLTDIVRRYFSDIPIIWGGKYPTLNPRKVLEKYKADYVCIGEGLDAFPDLLNAMVKGSNLSGIHNIWARRGESIIENKIRPLRRNLDDLPYLDWEIYDRRQLYRPFDGNIYNGGDHMLNWGCPYHCTYCINHFYHEMYDNKYIMRRYGVQRIVEELKYLKNRYGLTFFKFADEDFLMRPMDNFEELSETYKREVNLPFSIETNAKSFNKRKVELLKNMNCASVSIAIETGDPKLRRDLLGRIDTEEEIITAFKMLKAAGIRSVSFQMLGIPYETRATYLKTVEINRKANVQYPDAGYFYPFEGTKLREISIDEGFFDPEEESTGVFVRDKPALSNKELSKEDLIGMRNTFVLHIKLPECYDKYINRAEKQDELGMKLRGKLLSIYDSTVWKNNGWYSDDGRKHEYLNELDNILLEGLK